MDVVYFELNNWFSGRDYPNAEPFITWCGNDYNLYFANEEFVKNNQLCVVEQCIDMSVNWCITAPKAFVEQVCPKLLTDESIVTSFIRHDATGDHEYKECHLYKEFLREPDEDGAVYGRFGTEFLPWSEENVGIHFYDPESEDDSDDNE